MANVGDIAPEFTLAGTTGPRLRLRDLRGSKRALLLFYPRDRTSG